MFSFLIYFFLHLAISVEDKKEKTLNNVLTAKKKIRHEISELNERLKQSKEAILKMKEEIHQLQHSDIPLVEEKTPKPPAVETVAMEIAS